MTRSGKTAAASSWVSKWSRVVAWDPQHDWLKFGLEPVSDFEMLCSLLTSSATGPARYAFAGARGLFDAFCHVAFSWAKIEPACIVVEELAWVTHPGKAPDGWHQLVTGGLKFGLDIVSTTQRPAESDKTALSQSTIVRCFQQETFDDAKRMARELRVDVSTIDALEPLHYIEKNRRTRSQTVGRVTF